MTRFYTEGELKKAYELGWKEGQDTLINNQKFSEELHKFKNPDPPLNVISFNSDHFYITVGSPNNVFNKVYAPGGTVHITNDLTFQDEENE
jgi:hypothetical protein